MFYQKVKSGELVDPVYLHIDPRIIYYMATAFTNMNATANNAIKRKDFDHFSSLRFDIFQKGQWVGEDEKRSFQSEVLVLDQIPLEFIMNLKDYEG